MQNFIVLGYIPGTQVQITFSGWLFIIAGIAGLYLVFSYGSEEISIAESWERFSAQFNNWLSEPVIIE